MNAPVAIDQSNLAAPCLQVSFSAESSRRGSQRQVPPEKESEKPTPSSPRTRLTKKRAASLNTDAANEPEIGDPALNSARSSGSLSESMRYQVCLCQPDPKIPRPRNAFILYRQHYQAQVVAQNPGLANPEISKIIGEQWRSQVPDVKNDWKRLAEEEKQRHHRQYPNYRYQPRRSGKLNGIRPTSSPGTDDQVRCEKCHGRFITTPNTPSTPLTAAGSGSRSDYPISFPPISCATELTKPLYSQMQNTRMDTSRALPHQQGNQRTQYASAHPLSAHHERDEEMDLLSPLSGQKRRRFNEDNQRSYAINSPTSYSGSPQYRGQPPISAGGYRSQHMSGTGTLNRPGSIGLPPQHPSPVNQQARHQYPTRSNTFDESLRLPPLQTKVLTSATPSRRQDIRTEARELQARSIEAMVMTIPYINKIKVLRKISPPLQPPGPTSPAQETRGAVIAIEGPDKTLLADVGAFVCEYLLKDSSFSVQTWCSTSSSKRLSVSPSRDIEILDVTNSTPTSGEAQIFTKPEEKDPIVDYLSLISDWHNKSQDIIKYITSSPDVPTSNTNSAVSTSANIVPAPQDSKILPVALVLNGFSLTSSDQFALRTPINDSYAPVDHWQWMATLWRGIVGPDLTVYVTRVGREEMSKYGGVEIREDCAAIIVRIPEIGKMEEKASRRLGFEVVEFVRNVESAFGRA